jgi:hypothetical protein
MREGWYGDDLGGDPKAQDNIILVSHEQHSRLVRWWNDLYRSLKGPPNRDGYFSHC